MAHSIWERAKVAALAALGSSSAQGRLDYMNTYNAVRARWRTYEAMTRAEPTPRSFAHFVQWLGGNMEPGLDDGSLDQRFSPDQLDAAFETLAQALLLNGPVHHTQPQQEMRAMGMNDRDRQNRIDTLRRELENTMRTIAICKSRGDEGGVGYHQGHAARIESELRQLGA